MLQISSGKFFTSEHVTESQGLAVTHSNAHSMVPIVTRAATLEPSSTTARPAITTYIVRYVNRLQHDPPAPKGAVQRPMLVRTGDNELVDQFQTLCAFALGAFFDQREATVDVLCRDRPRHGSDSAIPAKVVGDYLEAPRQITSEDRTRLAALVDQAIGLHRQEYVIAVSCMKAWLSALLVVDQSPELAYSMLVYSIESLSRFGDNARPTWHDYEQGARMKVDTALEGTDEDLAESIRAVLLESRSIKVQRRYLEFALDHLDRSFFEEGAAGVTRPLRWSETRRALANAYAIRSGVAHRLESLDLQVRSESLVEGEVFDWFGDPHLTLRGLVRLTRHVIHAFVMSRPTVEREEIHWRAELPGTIRAPLGPKYWVATPHTFSPDQAHGRLSGFLDALADGQLLDIRPLVSILAEGMNQGGGAHQRSLAALVLIFETLAPQEDRLDGADSLLEKCQDLLGGVSIQAMLHRVFSGEEWPWPASECAEILESYVSTRHHKHSLRIPHSYEVLLRVQLAAAFLFEGAEEAFVAWMDSAVLDLPGQPLVQDALRKSIEARESPPSEVLDALLNSNEGEPAEDSSPRDQR